MVKRDIARGGTRGDGVERVADVERFVRSVVQFEWADYFVANPPETDETWVAGDVGTGTGRVAPEAWNPGRESGLDVYFRHEPTPSRLADGRLVFTLRVDGPGGDWGAADAPWLERADSRFAAGAADRDVSGSWADAGADLDERGSLWRAVYEFTPGSELGYYWALRTAVEDHAWTVPLLCDLLDAWRRRPDE